MIGALGTSLTWGADLPDARTQAWPAVLEKLLADRLGRTDVHLLNGAQRATSADFAALCFDELWGSSWTDARGTSRPPRLDLAVLEFTWSSSPSQIAALIDALHARGVPCIGVLYYHPVNVQRLGRIKNDPTPWKGAERAGHAAQFAHVFEARGVAFVNTSVLNARHGYRAMLNTTRGIYSAAHLSPLGHLGVATLLADLLIANCTVAFRLPVLSSAAAPKDYFCRIGSSLSDLRPPEEAAVDRQAAASAALLGGSGVASAAGSSSSNGGGGGGGSNSSNCSDWRLLTPGDGRTPGLVAYAPRAAVRLRLPVPVAGRFLSLGFEASHAHDGVARNSCGGGACWCAPIVFHAQTRKKYTYLQRTRPTWLAPVTARELRDAPSGDVQPTCELLVVAQSITRGRLMLKALTVSPPRGGGGNRSVSTASLYSLP